MCPGASGSFGMSFSDALRSSQLIPVMGVGPSSNKNIPDTRNALLRKQFANFSLKNRKGLFLTLGYFCRGKFYRIIVKAFILFYCKTLLYSCTFIAHVYILKQNLNNEIRVHCWLFLTCLRLRQQIVRCPDLWSSLLLVTWWLVSGTGVDKLSMCELV